MGDIRPGSTTTFPLGPAPNPTGRPLLDFRLWGGDVGERWGWQGPHHRTLIFVHGILRSHGGRRSRGQAPTCTRLARWALAADIEVLLGTGPEIVSRKASRPITCRPWPASCRRSRCIWTNSTANDYDIRPGFMDRASGGPPRPSAATSWSGLDPPTLTTRRRRFRPDPGTTGQYLRTGARPSTLPSAAWQPRFGWPSPAARDPEAPHRRALVRSDCILSAFGPRSEAICRRAVERAWLAGAPSPTRPRPALRRGGASRSCAPSRRAWTGFFRGHAEIEKPRSFPHLPRLILWECARGDGSTFWPISTGWTRPPPRSGIPRRRTASTTFYRRGSARTNSSACCTRDPDGSMGHGR